MTTHPKTRRHKAPGFSNISLILMTESSAEQAHNERSETTFDPVRVQRIGRARNVVLGLNVRQVPGLV